MQKIKHWLRSQRWRITIAGTLLVVSLTIGYLYVSQSKMETYQLSIEIASFAEKYYTVEGRPPANLERYAEFSKGHPAIKAMFEKRLPVLESVEETKDGFRMLIRFRGFPSEAKWVKLVRVTAISNPGRFEFRRFIEDAN